MKVSWSANWDDDLGGSPELTAADPVLRKISDDVRLEFERTYMFYLPRICEHCLNPVGLDYSIWPGQTSGLGSSLSDLFSRLPRRALSARLPDGAGPACGVQGRRAPGAPARERDPAPPDQPRPLPAGRPAVARGTVPPGPAAPVGRGLRGHPGDAACLAPAPGHPQMGLHQPAPSRTADRAGQFTGSFDAVFQAEGIRVLASPPQAPRANSICERIIGTLRRELFDRLLIVNERHLRRVLTEYLKHYNTSRPHRALGQLAPAQADTRPPQINLAEHRIRRKQVLGGLTHEYQVAA